ncbi:MAG: hypothetical protein A2X86_11945 [Bdellovibrionales bacterium GWA2_49_15]|nr:MAG: hypothetical protein A2X86_11945 [Bdellovibrionales bacterium GWA2_49_15]
MVAQTNPDKLDDFLRLWIKSKVQEFYRLDSYLKYVQSDIVLSHFMISLMSARSFEELIKGLATSDYRNGLKLSRKGDGKSFFEYPSLAFQLQSLISLWPDICALYTKKKFLESGDRFGHRPNLLSNFAMLSSSSSVIEKDIRVNCALKIPFQEDYPAFKKSAVEQAGKILKSSKSGNTNVLVIQSDIEKFFHMLKIQAVSDFVKSNFPDLAQNSSDFFLRLNKDFNFSSLPIGWALSGIFADLISVGFHEILNKELNSRLKSQLASVNIDNYAKKILSAEELSSEWIKKLPGLIETSNIMYKNVVSYVDDFIFFLEFSISEQFKEEKLLIKAFERLITHLVLDISETLINSIFPEKLNLKLYRPDDEKGKHFSFDRSNIDTLNSNFFNIAQNNTPSDPEEPNLWTRLDEFLLPADNDLTLNERTQFFSHLANIRHKVLEGEKLDERELEDIFRKILLKMQGTEAKYIASVMRLIEVLVVSDLTQYFDFGMKFILELREVFEKSSKPLELWLRYFSGYFRVVSRLSFDSRFKFFDDFERFIVFWAKSGGTIDDRDLLSAIRVTFLIRYVLNTTKDVPAWIEGMTRKRQVQMNSGALSSQFLAFNISSKSRKFRIHVNQASDSIAISALFREAIKYRKVGVSEFSTIGKKIGKKLGIESATNFVNASAYSVVPRWSTSEVEQFLSGLSSITSAQYANIFTRLLKRAKIHNKTIGNTYCARLKHAKSVLVDAPDSRIRNIPRAFGADDPKDYRSRLFYLLTLQSNSLQDLQRAYLASLAPIDFFRDFNFLHTPIASRVSGLGFIQIIREFMHWPRNSFSSARLLVVAKKVIARELNVHLQGSSALKQFKSDGVTIINLNELGSPYQKKERGLLLTLCPISIDAEKDFDTDAGLAFAPGVHEKLDLRIESAINEAKKRGANAIVFPELCLPRRYLLRYLKMCASRGLLLIAGLEYSSDHSVKCRNSTIISIPIQNSDTLFGRKFIAFEQDKHFPAAREKEWLETGTQFRYQPGKNLFIFNSKRYLNFAILTCSDFLSMRLRLKLQERIQTVFVPAQNDDTTTYNHIAETCIRDLHCFAVVCNNQELGASFVFAPFYKKNRRVVFNKEGSTLPEFLTMKWNPSAVLKSQGAESQTPFRPKDKATVNPVLAEMKQTPPDWGH